ncbi:MMPL family transporter [Antrihabitans sp. YC2-6]|uniref:MMPL family transporter n=1 Tax=Antrihabitans sp. YC2-6 TaxID=2799498 RepID=UPI0018F2BA08|nr:MMPL family transporter [Antrihabitans sp. YC2-6]MBJ8346130.1 MMPL family transporter [Antrihabitans sp. YC2-6]
MLDRAARLAINRPRTVLAGALLATILAILFGWSAASHLKSGGFVAPDSESTIASDLLAADFHTGEPNLVLLITDPVSADSTAARAVGAHVVEELRKEPDVSAIESYWDLPPGSPRDVAATLLSTDGKNAIITARVAGDDTDAPVRAERVAEKITGTFDDVTVRAGGFTISFNEMNQQITKDLAIAEAIAIPLTLLLLIWVFGSVVAAVLPVLVGLFAIVSTLAILRALTLVTDVSIFSLNMTSALGLALAIDYSLFIVSRYREELDRGLTPEAAVIRAVQTAGRTVLFSALTVALSLAAMAVFPQYFLKSFAYAGLAVVCAAAIASILVLPAALILLGNKVNAWDIRVWLRRLFKREAPLPQAPEDTLWYRFAVVVMRRAPLVLVAVVIFLLFLGAPFLNANFGSPDDRVNASNAASRQVGDILRSEFDQDVSATAVAILPGYDGDAAGLADYAERLVQVPGVTQVASAAGVYFPDGRIFPAPPGLIGPQGTFLSIGTSIDPFSARGATQIDTLRAVESPAPALFTGAAAINEDALDALGAKLPLAFALLGIATLILLFLFTGSVVLPVKALILNMLSLSAAFGAMVWIFQEGHFSETLDFTATGFLIPTMPILMFCLAFGMSMDYEVFLLSRIREEWLRSGKTTADNTRAVALGLGRTGRIITAAAALMAIVFSAMVTSKISFVQLCGLGMTLTVLADATLIRGILVPALMQLLGRFNWWAPKPLVALHKRIGLEESEESPAHPVGFVDARHRLTT